jgi:soluble lytic murein transglycosylase-like protein
MIDRGKIEDRTMARLFVLLLVAVASGLAAGVVRQSTAGSARAASIPASGTSFVAGRCPFPARYRRAFVLAATDTRLPLALLYSVAKHESNLRHDVRSSAGAVGLLQLMPATARSLKLDPSAPASNVLAGARYLRKMLDRFQSTDFALAAYTAGPTQVARERGIPDHVSKYVAAVTRVWRQMNGCT